MKARFQTLTYGPHSLNAFLEEKQEFDDLWHYHTDYELTYILRSTGTRYVGNNIENFKENDLVLIGPNVPHCWKNTDGQRVSAQAIVVCWNENLLHQSFIENKELAPIYKLISSSNQGLRFDETIACKLKRKFIRLINLPPFEKLILLLQILNELSKTCQVQPLCYKQIANDRNITESERINKIFAYIKQHYSERITLTDIASSVNMTEEYFSRFFSKMMKKTFFTFLNEYRINVACQLLLETDMQVTQICYNSGFESNAYFHRQFKKFKGYSPLFYKTQYEKLSNQ